MKISTKYPNFYKSILFFISDKNYSISSDSSRMLSFMVPLSNNKKLVDNYELFYGVKGVIFSVVTLSETAIIKRTNSQYNIDLDLSEEQWIDIIYQTSMNHFSSEEYLELKNDNTKTKGGCLGLLLFFTFLLTQIL
jgi:hypothetical protein